MLYADPFSGHLDQADPRTNLFVAGGCKWPTIPAFKYTAYSGNATGVFTQLNEPAGILLTKVGDGQDTFFGTWYGTYAPCLMTATLFKRYFATESTYRWQLTLSHPGCGGALIWYWDEDVGTRCNQALALGNKSCNPPIVGGTGSQFALYPVEWFAHEPPGVWPPV